MLGLSVLQGERPMRPPLMLDTMWSMLSSSWVHNPSERLSAKAIVQIMLGITKENERLPLPTGPVPESERQPQTQPVDNQVSFSAYSFNIHADYVMCPTSWTHLCVLR